MIRNLISRLMPGMSGGYQIITRQQAEAAQLERQWQDADLPKKQYRIVQSQLAAIRQQQRYPHHMAVLVAVMRQVMKNLNLPQPTVLEIGCSSGYFSEVFQLAGLNLRYSGTDYSSAFVDFAKQLYPRLDFKVADATALPYQDSQFDVAISGCCILHILNYPQAIAEAARVAKRYVIFSRTPVLHLADTTYTQKTGYGIPMIEIVFNESELFHWFNQHNLRVLDVITFEQTARLPGMSEPVMDVTYFCEKLSI